MARTGAFRRNKTILSEAGLEARREGSRERYSEREALRAGLYRGRSYDLRVLSLLRILMRREAKTKRDPSSPGAVRMTTKGKSEEKKKKQIPHPSALCAHGLRMTTWKLLAARGGSVVRARDNTKSKGRPGDWHWMTFRRGASNTWQADSRV